MSAQARPKTIAMTKRTATIEELRAAALTVAQAMQDDGGETLAPVFARLKAELDKAHAHINAIDHARAFLAENARH